MEKFRIEYFVIIGDTKYNFRTIEEGQKFVQEHIETGCYLRTAVCVERGEE